MEEQDKKIAEQLVEARIVSQADVEQALQEVEALQKAGKHLTIEEHLKTKKLIPEEFIVYPVIENITQMEVLDKHPPHRQFSGIRKDKTLWIFLAEMTPQEYETVRNRIHIIRECPSNFLIHPKGFGTLYPWKGYVIRYIPQGLSLNKFLAQEPEPDEIQSVANFLLQGMAELEQHFPPMPPCPAWIYVDAGVVQIAGQEGGPFKGEFSRDYRVPEGECTLPMNVYPLGKILLRLYYGTTEVTEDFLKSSFPRDLLIRKMIHPNPKHRYERFSQVWEDWQKIQIGLHVVALAEIDNLPFEAPPPIATSLTPEPLPETTRPPSTLKPASVRASSTRPSLRRKKSSAVGSLIISSVMILGLFVIFLFLSNSNKTSISETSQTVSKEDPFQEELKKVDTLVRRNPEAFEENMERYQRLRKYAKTEAHAFLIKERYEEVRANYAVFQEEQKEKQQRELAQKNPEKSPPEIKEIAKTDLPETTKDPEKSSQAEPSETEKTELFHSPREQKPPQTTSDFEELRTEIWDLAKKALWKQMHEHLDTFLNQNKNPEASFYLSRAEGLLALQESAKQTLQKSSEKEYRLSIRGQKYQGTVTSEAGKFLLKRTQGGTFPFEITDLEMSDLPGLGTFATAEDEVFFWLLLNQPEKAITRAQEIPDTSFLKPILDDQLQEKSASNDRERALQRWKKLQDLFKQKQFKSGKKLYDESLKLLDPIFPEIAEPLFELHRQYLKQLHNPAQLLSGGIRFFSNDKADLEYHFKRPEELQDFTLLGQELIWNRALQFTGEIVYAPVALQSPEIRLKITPPVELRFGNFRARIETNLIGDLDAPSPVTPEKLITFRFGPKDCEVFLDQLLLGSLDDARSNGSISLFAENRATLYFLGIRGTRLNLELETMYKDLEKWIVRSYPIAPGIQCKIYEDLDFYRQKSKVILPTLNTQWNQTFLPNTPEEGFSIRWSGLLYFPSAGERIFYCDSDEGIKLYLFEDRILNTQGLPDPAGLDEKELKSLENKKKAKIQLRHGFIPFSVEYTNKTRGGFIFICLEDPSGKRLPLPLIFHKISSE